MQIIWSDFAINNLKEIFDYYKTNVSLKIAHAIRKQILEATKQLQRFPESGSPEFYLEELQLNHRYLVINNYKIIYRISENKILINDVFDVRQSPNKMINKRTK